MNGNDVFFLVATPDAPAAVRETVVLVAVHGEQGSLGFILNRACPGLTYRDALIAVGIDPLGLELGGKLCAGGPVRPDAAWLLFDGSAFDGSAFDGSAGDGSAFDGSAGDESADGKRRQGPTFDAPPEGTIPAARFALPDDSCALGPGIHVTASADATLEVLQRTPRVKTLLCRGHTTWEAGELDAEIAGGQWLRSEAHPGLVFDTPFSRRWSEALCASLGLSRPWLGEARFARA